MHIASNGKTYTQLHQHYVEGSVYVRMQNAFIEHFMKCREVNKFFVQISIYIFYKTVKKYINRKTFIFFYSLNAIFR